MPGTALHFGRRARSEVVHVFLIHLARLFRIGDEFLACDEKRNGYPAPIMVDGSVECEVAHSLLEDVDPGTVV